MYFSITFINGDGVKRNTWADWGLIPTTPPIIEPPSPFSNYVSIPGGIPIDVTDCISNAPSFENSEGSWNFVFDGTACQRIQLFQELKSFLHGKKLRVELEEDPLHYYVGRFSVKAPQTGNVVTTFSIDYTISPVRYKYDDTQDGV